MQPAEALLPLGLRRPPEGIVEVVGEDSVEGVVGRLDSGPDTSTSLVRPQGSPVSRKPPKKRMRPDWDEERMEEMLTTQQSIVAGINQLVVEQVQAAHARERIAAVMEFYTSALG